MKKDLLSCLGKTLSLIEECFCCHKSWCCHLGVPPRHPEPHPRHPEFISGSQESKEMLNPVQHDNNRIGQMLKQAQYVGWHRTSLALGRSMIEMLGVLAIIGVLSIGGLYAYRQAMDAHKVNQLADAITKMKFFYLENYEYGNRTDSGQDAILPIRNALCQTYGEEFCKDVFLGCGDWVLYRTPSNFMIYFTGVPTSICHRLIDRDWLGEQPRLRNFYINRWKTDPLYKFDVQNGKVIDSSAAHKACDNGSAIHYFGFVFNK